ncbi:MAG: hypothetical protein CL693_06855 [Cellvibrionaceae bacterium]|nr:hypothetical protein [Cellvibrionaceae bacterium]|tara:strand:- start:63164 stop:63601 length:438 start_codon:yes stop_codon:yes gene_type:complete
MKLCLNKFYLFVAGLTMLLVGSFIALTPNEYLMSMGAQPDQAFSSGLPQGYVASTNLISDLRGMGGMLLFIGTYVFISTFKAAWRHPALLISTLVYSAFVVFRTTGFIFEGFPSMGILTAYFIELVIALIGLFLMKTKKRELAGV